METFGELAGTFGKCVGTFGECAETFGEHAETSGEHVETCGECTETFGECAETFGEHTQEGVGGESDATICPQFGDTAQHTLIVLVLPLICSNWNPVARHPHPHGLWSYRYRGKSFCGGEYRIIEIEHSHGKITHWFHHASVSNTHSSSSSSKSSMII
jgi:hypothetical protein